ncbi:MAG TPA: TauD/TfdA family dioxygenase, partial [Xanthobacteraceae bacterium]|nr:TauD/TfdA family dioxygenase [Xanthobacteraceae bacterium]
MRYDTITVTPSTPHIGAEIGNIDLTKPLTNRQVEEVHDAIIAHGVIFFRDQNIDFASHERFIRYFGEPHVHVGGAGTASSIVPDHPAIRKQHFDKNSKRVSGEQWHSDQSCAEFPPAYSVLHQEIIPPDGGGDTMFLSAYKAYEELSPSMKAYLEGKTATHDGSRVFDKGKDTYPTAVHPVVVRHPESG